MHFVFLPIQIEDVSMISLVDRDTSAYNTITYKLENTSFKDKENNQCIYARFRKWRRSEIENYLLSKSVLSRVSGMIEAQIEEFFTQYALFYLVQPILKNLKCKQILDLILISLAKNIWLMSVKGKNLIS